MVWEEPTATDNQGSPLIQQTSGNPSGSEFKGVANSIVFEAKDEEENVAYCRFTVTVKGGFEARVN